MKPKVSTDETSTGWRKGTAFGDALTCRPLTWRALWKAPMTAVMQSFSVMMSCSDDLCRLMCILASVKSAR